MLESLRDDELGILRSALPTEERKTPLEELHPADCFCALRAVILHNVDAGTLDEIRGALNIFNEVIESGLTGVGERNPCSSIELQTAGEFAPWLIDRLLASVELFEQARRSDPYEDF